MEPQHESDLVERVRNWESKETFRLQELPSRTSRSPPVAAPLKRLSSPCLCEALSRDEALRTRQAVNG
jgi:hypothetical protein